MSLSLQLRRYALSCLIAISVFAGVTLSSSAAHAETRIAVIDLRRAIADTEDGMRVQAELQELFDSRQTEFESKEKAYAAAKADFEKRSKEGNKKDEVELRKRYAALEKMAFELQAAQTNYRREMQQKENQLMYPIVTQMLQLVESLASKNSYDMVLNKEAVPYFRSDLDITDRVIQMYNASRTPAKGPVKKAPAKAPPKKSPAKSKTSRAKKARRS